MMKKINIIPFAFFAMTMATQAFVIEKDNHFELASICHEGGMNITDFGLPNGTEIQNQDGKIGYIGENASFSTLTNIKAGTAIFIKGSAGTEFDTGSSRSKIEVVLKRTGFNFVGSCQTIDTDKIDMSKHSEMQDAKGRTLYDPTDEVWGDKSDLDELEIGKGYWLKSKAGNIFYSKNALSVPKEFLHQTINNDGESIETTYKEYTIKLLSDTEEEADSRRPHTSILVRVNGHDTEPLRIQDTYNGKKIVIAVYDANNELVAISKDVIVDTSNHGNVVDITFEEEDGGSDSCNVTDNYQSFVVAKDNALNELSKPFNGFEVKVTTSAIVNGVSSTTKAIYGEIIDGIESTNDATGALFKLNDGYPSDTIFVVKVYKDGVLVGISSEVSGTGSAVNFGSITTQSCSE
jgi:hypothetical protein